MNSDSSGASLEGLRANLQCLLKTLQQLLAEIETMLLPGFARLSEELREKIASADVKYAGHFAKLWFKAFLGIKDEIMVLSKGEVIRRYHVNPHGAFLHSRSRDAHLYNKKYRLSACCKDGIDYEYRHVANKYGHKSFLDKIADKMDIINDRIDAVVKDIDAQFRKLEASLVAKGAKGVTFILQHNSEIVKAQLATEQTVNLTRSSMTENSSRADSLSTTIDDPTELLSNKSLVTSAYETLPSCADNSSSASAPQSSAVRKRALALIDSDDEHDKADVRRKEQARKLREATDFQLSVSIGGIKREFVSGHSSIRGDADAEDFRDYVEHSSGNDNTANGKDNAAIASGSVSGTASSGGDSSGVIRALKLAIKSVPRRDRSSLLVKLLEGIAQSSKRSSDTATSDGGALVDAPVPMDIVIADNKDDTQAEKLLIDALRACTSSKSALECFEMLRVRLHYPSAQLGGGGSRGAAAFDYIDIPLYFSYYSDISSSAPPVKKELCVEVSQLFAALRDAHLWQRGGGGRSKILPHLPYLAHCKAGAAGLPHPKVYRRGDFVPVPADPLAVLGVYCSRSKRLNALLDSFSCSGYGSSASGSVFDAMEKLSSDAGSCDLSFTDFESKAFEQILRIKLSQLQTESGSCCNSALDMMDISNSRNVSGVTLELLLRLAVRVDASAALSTACLVEFVANYSSRALGAADDTAGEGVKLSLPLRHLNISHNGLNGGSGAGGTSELLKSFESIVRRHSSDELSIIVNDRILL